MAVGFRPEDAAFREEFNAVLAEYLGTDEMMEKVAAEDYTAVFLPDGQTTADACKAD